ncbi:MAG: hypothetical protein RQ826_14330 [Xanthomonadales bacterium]|nr:hypothetical protein [Xanthomonadales bacterium]
MIEVQLSALALPGLHFAQHLGRFVAQLPLIDPPAHGKNVAHVVPCRNRVQATTARPQRSETFAMQRLNRGAKKSPAGSVCEPPAMLEPESECRRKGKWMNRRGLLKTLAAALAAPPVAASIERIECFAEIEN